MCSHIRLTISTYTNIVTSELKSCHQTYSNTGFRISSFWMIKVKLVIWLLHNIALTAEVTQG
jgi:hypothetical protein